MCFRKKKNYIFEEDLYKKNKGTLFSASDYVKDDNEAFLNPFINKSDQQKSIEEYGVKYKRNFFSKSEDVYLGSIIRNDFISKKKKWKTFKKYIKSIRKDYKEHIEILEEKKKSNQIVYDSFKVKKLTKRFKIFILISWFINLLVTGITKAFFSNLFTDYLFLGVVILGYSLLLTFWFVTTIHKNRYQNINNIQKRYTKKLAKYFRVERKKFKKYYQMIYKYYYKNIFSNNFYYEAKDFNDFWEDKYSYQKAIENNENIESNLRRLVIIQKRYQIFKNIFVIVNVLSIVALLYVMIIKLV